MEGNQFIRYQVKVDDDLYWNLVSPESVYKKIDLPFWSNRSSEIENVSNVSLTLAQERSRFFDGDQQISASPLHSQEI